MTTPRKCDACDGTGRRRPRECEVCAGTGELTGPYVQAHANAHVRGAPRDERGRVRELSVVPVRARRGPRRADT